jgi:nucleoside-diphosphate-sugar epimerase
MSTVSGPILITGAGGFVGSCLARRLVEQGQAVHLLLRGDATPWRLADLVGRFVRHNADLRDQAAVNEAVRACRPRFLFHLAAHGAYPGQRDRSAVLASNLLGTANLLSAAAEVDYQALVHTGSSSEYGHKRGPMRPCDVLEPRTDYGVAKAAATLLCQAEALRGRPVTTVRIFSAYGPWDDPGRLVQSVMASCLRQEPPRVTGGGQRRDFIHVEDVLDLLLRAACCPAAQGRILHAGGGRPCTVRDMVETIVEVCTAGRLRPRYGEVPARPDEPASWVADLAETTGLTGWVPRLDLQAGVARTWEWFRTAAGRQAA